MVLGSGIRYPGSEIRDPEKTYSGSRIQGSKRHRIPDPDPQHWVMQWHFQLTWSEFGCQRGWNLLLPHFLRSLKCLLDLDHHAGLHLQGYHWRRPPIWCCRHRWWTEASQWLVQFFHGTVLNETDMYWNWRKTIHIHWRCRSYPRLYGMKPGASWNR